LRDDPEGCETREREKDAAAMHAELMMREVEMPELLGVEGGLALIVDPAWLAVLVLGLLR
jgi:hypothetical protein